MLTKIELAARYGAFSPTNIHRIKFHSYLTLIKKKLLDRRPHNPLDALWTEIEGLQ